MTGSFSLIPLEYFMSPFIYIYNGEAIFTSDEANWKEINMYCSGLIYMLRCLHASFEMDYLQ